MGTTLLQLFLLLTALCVGAALTLALQHALAHYRPEKHDAEHPGHGAATGTMPAGNGHETAGAIAGAPDADGNVPLELPAEARDKLLHVSEQNFQEILDKSADSLEHDLAKTAGELNAVLQRIGTQIVGNEMERYKTQLEEIRQQAAGAIGSAQDEIAKHQAELKAKLQEEHAALTAKLHEEIMAEKQRQVADIMAERQQILDRVDKRLADTVASFLLETLGQEVDLGAQQAYLTAQLEAHKDEFTRGVAG